MTGVFLDIFYIVKTLHILSATVLFGTGLGIAFLNLWGQCQPRLSDRYVAARLTVVMDFVFTTPAVILQPLTGLYLAHLGGYDLSYNWLLVSYGLYVVAGLCWIPVVWLQIKIRNILQTAIANGDDIAALPSTYKTYLRIWFFLGWPAFLSLIIIFYLMTIKGVPG